MAQRTQQENLCEVSVVMPCLNEEKTLGVCIQKAMTFFHDHKINGEVVISDNGSTDGSVALAESLGARVVRTTEKGYGAALRGGIKAAYGQYIIMGDADDSYDFSQLQDFITKLREGFDLVMGCRFPRGGGKIMPGAMPWKHKWIGNPILTAIGRLFFRSPIKDFHCGLRGFSVKAYKEMDLHTPGMEFASEMVAKASLLNMRVTNVPIILHKDGRDRPPHLRSWRDGWRHLRFMLLYTPRWLFLMPGMLLFLLGALGFVALLPGPFSLGAVSFDTNTLLISMMCIVIGFQLVGFSVFARTYAVVEGLLPKSKRLDRTMRFFQLEYGLVLGLLLFLAGMSLLVWSVFYWKQSDFGIMSYPDSLRIVIPGVTAVTLGLQIIFTSFFLNILNFRKKT